MTVAPTPPRPRPAIRVGVTGHRLGANAKGEVRLPDAAIPTIAATVGVALDAIAAAAEAVRTRHAGVFAPAGPGPCARGTEVEAVIVSGLASGADQIVAQAALDRGFVLDAVLPFPAGEYRRDHEAAGTTAPYDALLAAARATFALDGSRDAAPRAYEAAGLVMLANVDILIAIWNRAPPGGRGGTAEIVERAVADGMPVVLIEPARPETARLVWTGAEPLPPASARLEDLGKGDRDPTFGAVVEALLAPPLEGAVLPPQTLALKFCRFARALSPLPRRHHDHDQGPGDHDAGEDIALSTYLGERQRRWHEPIAWCFPLLLGLFACRPFGRGDVRAAPYVAAVAAEWAPFLDAAPAAAPALRAAIATTLLPAFAFADKLGIRYALLYRGAFVGCYALAAIAVAFALTGVIPFVADAPWWKAGLVTAEVVIIGLILWIVVQGSAARWHARFLAYRRLAEVLRPMRVLALLGAPDPVGRPMGAAGPSDGFAPWYARAIRRTIPLPNATVDSAYLAAVRAAAAECRAADGTPASEIESQIAYHRSTAARAETMEHALHAWGERLFKATLFVGVAFVVVVIWLALTGPPGLAELKDKTWWAYPAKWIVTFLMALFPTVGAALSAIRVQGDFAATAQRSRRSRSRLKRIRAALVGEAPSADGPASEAEPLSFARLSDRTVKAVDAMQTDLAQWHALSRTRPLSLPA